MPEYDIAEVEDAFRTYWRTGAVDEDWDAWADLFTDDAEYREYFLGFMRGREEIRAWIKPIMAEYGELYTAYEWHMCEPSGRCVVDMQNRRDNPDPSAPPIDFPGMTVLQYAGGGKFSMEEDFWSVKGGMETVEQYATACQQHDPDHSKKRTRLHWGNGPEWTQGASSYDESAGARKANA